MRSRAIIALAATLCLVFVAPSRAAWIWIEGEKPSKTTMNRHPWWYDQVKREHFSGGDFTSNFHDDKSGEAEYWFQAPQAGKYDFWVHANPVQAKLAYRLNGGKWTDIDLSKDQTGSVNVAADGKPDLRFIAWVKVGPVELKRGANVVRFKTADGPHHHGYLDCFVFANEPFQPQGVLKPDEIAAHAAELAKQNEGWFAFNPPGDNYPMDGFDLRSLNEKVAGEGGFITVEGSQFIHQDTHKPVRFWAVNGPPHEVQDAAALARLARLLAKYGVNLVRIHGGYFDESGEIDAAKVKHAFDVVDAMKAEGIYSHFSIYFPLWLRPKPGTKWLPGYDGQKLPFAALYFNPDFQKQYQSWWQALLTTKNEKTGKRLVDEPAVAGVELVNEDSYFFWTFNSENLPAPELEMLEKQFAGWLKTQYGSLDKALARWQGVKTDRDDPASGRLGFRPLWNMFNEKTVRDQDAARFLLESQRGFYRREYQFLRDLGFRGVVTASNWATASPQIFGPLEKYSYTVTDFIDRHGYFGCRCQGEAAEWSLRDGHTYADRSALRFDPEEPGKPKLFVHPAMDPSYDNKPSMISETTFNRPNRYRSEAPLYYACYGALQGTDSIVHFALDGTTWTVKPGYFMQPWTLMSPAMMGQFPAAALIFRQGLVSEGDELVNIELNVDDLLALKGTPLAQDAALDELRLNDVPKGQGGTDVQPDRVIDPLIHYAGRTNVSFTQKTGSAKLADPSRYIDREHRTVTSSNGQLKLDYRRGLLTIDAPAAQGVSGALAEGGPFELSNLSITSDMALGHVVAVSLDGAPLASSKRILLQVMSEEKSTGFRTEPVNDEVKKIVDIGHDPWLVKEVRGVVRCKRPDAGGLKVIPLDQNGNRVAQADKGGLKAGAIQLRPDVLYYLITGE